MASEQADGKRLREICGRKLMTLQDLSRLARVSYRTVKTAAANGRLSPVTLNAIAQALEVEVGEITIVAAVEPVATR